jgi:O-antigen/teichoic acid export membrane protein
LVWAVLTAIAAVAAAPWDGRLAGALGVLAACLPLLLLQDVGRFMAIAFREPIIALWLDLIWLVLMIGGVAAIAVTGGHNLNALMLAWAGSGALAGVVALLRWGSLTVPPSRTWITDTWGLAWRFAISFAALQASVLGLATLVRDLYGAAIVGAFVGAQLFMRPYTTVEVALMGSAVAEIAHEAGDRAAVWRHVRRISLLATTVATINALIMIGLPGVLGRLVLGSTWTDARHYLLPLAVQLILLALTVGPRAGLVGTGYVNRLMGLNLVFVPVLFVASIVGAAWDGPLGLVWGMTAGWAFAASTWWVSFIAKQRVAAP